MKDSPLPMADEEVAPGLPRASWFGAPPDRTGASTSIIVRDARNGGSDDEALETPAADAKCW